MRFKDSFVQGIWATLVIAEMSEVTMQIVELLRFGDYATNATRQMVEDRRLLEELSTDMIMVPGQQVYQ
jgi:hypothetical protein